MTDLENRIAYLRTHRAHDPEYDLPPRYDAAREDHGRDWWSFALCFSAPFVGAAMGFAVAWGLG